MKRIQQGIPQVVEATQPKKTYASDPLDQMTACLEAMVERRGWLD